MMMMMMMTMSTNVIHSINHYHHFLGLFHVNNILLEKCRKTETE